MDVILHITDVYATLYICICIYACTIRKVVKTVSNGVKIFAENIVFIRV